VTRFPPALVLLSLLAVAGGGCAPGDDDVAATMAREQEAGNPGVDGLAEASTNFAQSDITPFLTRISRHFSSGLDAQAIARLDAAVAAVPYEQTQRWEIDVVHEGRPERIVFAAYKDDALSPDVYFFTTPEIAAKISQDMEDYATGIGY
jgi:hypothetical protein